MSTALRILTPLAAGWFLLTVATFSLNFWGLHHAHQPAADLVAPASARSSLWSTPRLPHDACGSSRSSLRKLHRSLSPLGNAVSRPAGRRVHDEGPSRPAWQDWVMLATRPFLVCTGGPLP
jgi:hypothetical protein